MLFADHNANGFVAPTDITDLNCPQRHKFRLTHDHIANVWKFDGAFFGGKAGASCNVSGTKQRTVGHHGRGPPYNKKFKKPSSGNGTCHSRPRLSMR